MGKDDYLPLFETRSAKGRLLYWLYAVTVFLGVISMCAYRVRHFPAQELKRWVWIAVFMAELWNALYWLITQSVRCSPVYRYTFKDRLSQRYEEVLPGIDIFVCTADPVLEPPVMVINTVLTVMAYNYPPEKLNVYLSDDGGSEVMFYALLEASQFSKIWLPFCRKFKVEPRSPDIYFSSADEIPVDDVIFAKEWQTVKHLFQEMKERINEIMKLGRIPDELQKQHKGFREWELGASKRDHQTILEILIDGRDSKAMDVEGKPLPTLIYMAREKKPQYQHNFKAGAMNALIRVSSRISNSPIILNVDCDQYSNNSESVRDALCFFMDEEMGHNIAYVQYPQYFNNITKNDVYGNYLRIIVELELPGADAHGGPPYIGSGCFHRRDALSGKKHEQESKIDWKKENEIRVKESASTLEETAKILAGCNYEENSQWGKEVSSSPSSPTPPSR
ncbi:Cellulose synthase-like protein E1 [Forsythia ovata]|uniref:Cellulose synthase-like protein E1 n=1 Tax=Forsythia ovata TaxID=205694 RepID=A0ABD1R662_9LAMI